MPKYPYNPADWYWFVADSTTQVYSTKAVNYVPVSDPAYQAWLAPGNVPSTANTEQALIDHLLANGVPVPAGAGPSDTLKDGMFANIPHAVQVWAFDIENRVRALEGQPPRTAAQFKNYVKSLPQM